GWTCSSHRSARKRVPHPFAHLRKGGNHNSTLSSCPRAKRAVDGPAVRIGQHEKGCPILSRTCERGGTTTLGCHPAPERSAQWMNLQFASVSTKRVPHPFAHLRKGGNHNSRL